tara:strand:- start:292 stop:1191 length:900 start_codon:yes stop_codon:yes gene_type:complete
MPSYPFLEKKYKKIQLTLLVNVSLVMLVLGFIDIDIFSYQLQYYLLIIFVAVIGLPHGFFDYMISQKLYSHVDNWIIKFSVGYVCLSILYLIVWISYPAIALILFLVLAMIHFGMEEYQSSNIKHTNKTLMIIIGSIPIVLPVMFHTENVFFIFQQIIDDQIIIPNFNTYLKITYLILITVVLLLDYKRYLAYVFLIPSLVFLPPLISFIIYFCFHHSLNHYIDSIFRDDLMPKNISLGTFLVAIGLTSIVFTGLVLFIMNKLAGYSIDVAIAKYTFIVLACLTLPHLLLNIYYETKKV